MSVRLGLCCLNTKLRDQKPPVFASRRMIVRTVLEQGVDVLKEKILQNLRDVITMIKWNEKHGIKVFRLSSELFPHKTNPAIPDYTFDFAVPLLQEIGNLARSLGHRLTFHPGQYNVVGTPDPARFKQTSDDLEYHATVLDIMGMGDDSVMVVHAGGLYGDKEATKERWCKQFMDLPDCVRRRLVLENCEHAFHVQDCLDVSAKIGIPVVFDTHHHECYRLLHKEEQLGEGGEYMEAVLETWRKRSIKPKFHVSEQGAGRTGHHSDFVEVIPEYLLEIPTKYGVSIDIMIEAKLKEQAVLKLMRKYGSKVGCKRDWRKRLVLVD